MATLTHDPDFGDTWQGTLQEFLSSINQFGGWKKTQKRTPDEGWVMLDVRPGGGFTWNSTNEHGGYSEPQTRDVICDIKSISSPVMSRADLDDNFVVKGHESMLPSEALFQELDQNYPYVAVERKPESPIFGFIPNDPENFEITSGMDNTIFLNTDCMLCVKDPANIHSLKDLDVVIFPEDTYEMSPWGRQNFDPQQDAEMPIGLVTNVTADLLTESYIDPADLKTLAKLRTKKLDKLNKKMHTQNPELAAYIDKELQFAFDGLDCTRTFLTKWSTKPRMSSKTSGVLDGLKKSLDAYPEFKEARAYIKALKETWETHLPIASFSKNGTSYTMYFQEAEEDINFGTKAEHARQNILAEISTGIEEISNSKTASPAVPKI